MKEKSTPRERTAQSAFFTPRVVLVLLLCAAACFITGSLLGLFAPEATANCSQRNLTFAERAAYQRAIEEVYWRHQIWPKERPDRKPSLDVVISQAQLEKKVEDYLRKSQALENYWQRPITAEQLQAEMDRMAKHTKQPEVLRELFEALGNDPFVIAECLARPALGERLLRNWYAYDQRIQGELRLRAEADLQAHPTVEEIKQTSGMYGEIELTRNDGAHEEINRRFQRGVKLNSSEWSETEERLRATFEIGAHASIPTGKLSRLQEDETRYYATEVIEKTASHLKLATVSWRKEPLESWLTRVGSELPNAMVAQSAHYMLPAISDVAGCTDNTWTATAGPPDARYAPTAVWTGSEMIVWGGSNQGGDLNTGGRYNPATDSWTMTSNTNAPTARAFHTAVWTGTEMIVWGGYTESPSQSGYFNTGGRYSPGTDTWTATSTTNAPSARAGHTAVWTGSEMIVWGGATDSSGGKYNPATNTWAATSTSNAPSARAGHTAVWTASEMIVWGGANDSSGGRYNPAANTWAATSTTNAPSARAYHSAVWTGSEMIVWGGADFSTYFNTGGRYNPSTNSWTDTTTTNAPTGRESQTAVWTGAEMIVWGGYAGSSLGLNTGGKYSPSTNSWMPTSTINAPSTRYYHTALWTGAEMIIWGGTGSEYGFNSGGKYKPGANTWTVTATLNAPAGRSFHTAVWTGTEMIIWGGFDRLNTGGTYDPSTDSWSAITTTNAPHGRYHHTAVWTGDEMIVWGGRSDGYTTQWYNTGGKYNPRGDRWYATSTSNAPSAREYHTAVWTGSEMIVWGGWNSSSLLNTGARYNPHRDTWTSISTTNAPSARVAHTGVWTGSEMIVWGGYSSSELNTGGRYDPYTNGWTTTNINNAPSARYDHTTVWTGNEMIVWGGVNNLTDLNTGSRYNPATDDWVATNVTNAPDGRLFHTAVWTGNEMIVWGGANFVVLNSGARYNPGADDWTPTSSGNAPGPRARHTAVWAGEEMIVWGGSNGGNTGGNLNTGGRYCAQSGATPTPTPTPVVPPRPRPTPAPRRTPH